MRKLDQIAEIAESTIAPDRFFQAVLDFLVTDCAMAASAVWSVERGVFKLRYQTRLLDFGIEPILKSSSCTKIRWKNSANPANLTALRCMLHRSDNFTFIPPKIVWRIFGPGDC